MASLGPEIFSRGFRLNPTPLEAATYYLPQLLAGAPLHEAIRPFIHHADVYACEPGELARQFRPLPRTGHRFFFTHCKLQQPHKAGKAGRATRAAGAGSWHSQGVTDVVDRKKVKVGEMRKLRYKKGGAYTDWLMDEYSCCLQDAVVGDRQYVFCNIYVSPRAAPGSATRQESAAFFATPAPAPAPVVIAQAPPPKRLAPQVAEPPCPKRTRGAVVAPVPPVVQPAASCTAYFAPPRPCVPNGSVAPSSTSTPSVIRSSPASAQPPARAPTHLAAPPSRTPAHGPPQPVAQPKQQICLGGVAPPSTPSVSSPASAHPPASAPTRLAALPRRTPAPAPPQPVRQPKQQMPPPIPPVVRACHMPVQAPAQHCRPQPSAQTKKKTRDPFEAAEPRERDEAEEERVAAFDLPSEESPAALQDDDFDEDDLAKAMEEAVKTAEAEEEAAGNSTMTDDEMEQHIFSLLGNDTVIVPKEEKK
ncbi:hypothetical protein GQ55_8G023500 [Panicum hallii var. hallii]|uniref:NAC domain-containing protein n=1 Tax=Panicum hallii var. hallii TaxID=1504633 RepID=A0A2T7CJX8_9POAL|nr:hypothetical protein GQ55_8G023500 [Panicum hallii var. hallii]